MKIILKATVTQSLATFNVGDDFPVDGSSLPLLCRQHFVLGNPYYYSVTILGTYFIKRYISYMDLLLPIDK